MTTPTLPSQFKPIFGSYSHGAAGGVIRTEVSGGANRYALAYDRGMQKWNVTFNLRDAAYSAWVAFFHHVIKKGAISFQMNLDSGFGLEPHIVNILPDTYAQNSTEWDTHIVSFVCEGESTVYSMSEEDGVAMVDMYSTYGDYIATSFDSIEKFATVDSDVLVPYTTPPYSGPLLSMDFVNNLYRSGRYLPSYPLSSIVTFTRASGATRVNASGLVELVGSDVPRFDYNPVTLACNGLLIEEQRTNLLTYSEQFDNAAWTKTNSTIAANAAIAPDGTMTADKRVENTAGGYHSCSQFVTVAAGAITYSIYAKSTENSVIALDIYNATDGTATAFFNLSTKSLGSISDFFTGAVTSNLADVGNGWVRCSITVTLTAVSTRFGTSLCDGASETLNYTGDGTSGLYIWGAQLEAGAFPTSYIPTTSAAATRTADIAAVTGTNFSSWYRQDEGTFVVNADTFGNTSAFPTILWVSDGTNANNFGMYRYLAITGTAQRASNVAQGDITAGSAISGQFKTAYSYRVNDSAMSTNGSALSGVAIDNTLIIPNLNKLNIGVKHDGGAPLNGHIRSIQYYPSRRSNEELQGLST